MLWIISDGPYLSLVVWVRSWPPISMRTLYLHCSWWCIYLCPLQEITFPDYRGTLLGIAPHFVIPVSYTGKICEHISHQRRKSQFLSNIPSYQVLYKRQVDCDRDLLGTLFKYIHAVHPYSRLRCKKEDVGQHHRKSAILLTHNHRAELKNE